MSAFQKLRWLTSMAWRDSRRNPSRLFLFLASVILGIAALVSIYSVGDNLSTQIEDQAATLLGADQEWITNRPFLDEENAKADSLAEEISEEWSFASMISFPKNQGTRLTQIRALKGNFPYYGQLETNPENARIELDNGQKALVDQNLLLQFGIDVGDSIKVGDVIFEIAGALLQAPGQTGIVATVAPVVYIPLAYLEETGLNQKGSRINYRLFLRLKEPAESNKIAETLSE
ncbi:MAG: ABC transporter permease, partial [Spirosomataceae bacterium]